MFGNYTQCHRHFLLKPTVIISSVVFGYHNLDTVIVEMKDKFGKMSQMAFLLTFCSNVLQRTNGQFQEIMLSTVSLSRLMKKCCTLYTRSCWITLLIEINLVNLQR